MLKDEMAELVNSAKEYILINPTSKHIHGSTCEYISDMFELWENDKYPLWLSKVVEGAIAEIEEIEEEKSVEETQKRHKIYLDSGNEAFVGSKLKPIFNLNDGLHPQD